MTAHSLYWLDHIDSGDRLRVGDKALRLAQAYRQGYPVLPSVVIPCTALHSSLQYTPWPYPLLTELADSSMQFDVYSPRQLQAVARHLRHILAQTPISEEFISHILNTCSTWAAPALILRPSVAIEREPPPNLHGVLDARVCAVHPQALAQALRQVWGEIFRARSLVFWHRLGLSLHDVHLAVLIQPIDDAIASGDLHVRGAEADIRATFGLRQTMTQGEVSPDEYHLNLHHVAQLEEHLSVKPYQACLVRSESNEPLHLMAAHAVHVDADISHLEIQPIDVTPEQHTQAALNPTQVQHLIQIAQQFQAEPQSAVRVDWTIPHSSVQSRDSSPIQIVGITPLGRPMSMVSSHAATAQAEGTASNRFQGLAAAPGQAIAPAWVMTASDETPTEIPTNAILVAPSVRPDWLSWLHRVSGIVTEQGGMTSHAAILARELGIPATVGVAHVTQMLKTGDSIYLDGDRGTVQQITAHFETPAALKSPEHQHHLSHHLNEIPSALGSSESAHLIQPHTVKTRLFVNWGQLEQAEHLAALPVDGVGLLRSEFLLRDRLHLYCRSDADRNWAVADIVKRVQEIARAFFPRPVFYRTLDLRSHEIVWEHHHSAPELNPMLGMHGTLSYQTDPSLLDLEIAAIAELHRAGWTNVRMLLPFVRTVEEFVFCRQRLKQAAFPSLEQLEVWIMAEVPSVLFLLPAFAKAGVNGISIGSNDLTQLMLGVDRDQAEMAIAYDPMHPAVLSAIQHLVKTARQLGLPCSICGQAASQYPELIEYLVSWGISSISVSPDAVAASRSAIARAEANALESPTHAPFTTS